MTTSMTDVQVCVRVLRTLGMRRRKYWWGLKVFDGNLMVIRVVQGDEANNQR